MALTKVITGVTDLNQAQSTNGLKFPTGSVFAGTPEQGMIRNALQLLQVPCNFIMVLHGKILLI
jgi:hypothetical protein